MHTETHKNTQMNRHMFTQACDTYIYMHKHDSALNICKSIWAHKLNLRYLQLHTPIQTHRMCEILRGKFFWPADAEEKQHYQYTPNTVNVMNGYNHNICIRPYTLWQTQAQWWAGFRVRDHFLPWGLGDGLLLFWPITREHWLTPPAHWSWVINYQAVPCLGQMNISTWLPWNNEPHPKSLKRPLLGAL